MSVDTPASVALAATSAALLERESHTAAAREVLATARADGSAILIFEGPAGSGKSRLLEMAAEEAARDGFEVAAASGHERETEIEFGVAWQLVEGLAGRVDPRARDDLMSGPARGAAPLIADGPRSPAVAEDPLRVQHGVYGFLGNASRLRPLMLLLDDAHLADNATLRFLLYLVQRLDPLPVALVIAARTASPSGEPELLAEVAAHPSALRCPCPPLSAASVALCVLEALSPDADNSFCQACFQATGGNPLLLWELFGELLARGIEPGGQSADEVRELGPKGVADAVELRLRRREPGTLELARAVAVAGHDAELRHCASIADMDQAAAARAADALIEEDVLRLSDRLEFVHPIVGQALYLHQPPASREAGHLKLAQLLSSESGAPERVALHLLTSPRMGKRWVGEALCSAASAALVRGSPTAAISYLQRALKEPPAPDMVPRMMLALGRAEAVAGEPEAVQHLSEAAALLEDPRKRALVSLDVGRTMFAQGRIEDAAEAFRRGALDAQPTDRELHLTLDTSRSLLQRVAGLDHPGMEPPDPDAVVPDAGETSSGRMLLAHLALERALSGGTRDEVIEFARRAFHGRDLLLDEAPSGLCFHFAAVALVVAEDLQGAEVALAMAVDESLARGSTLGLATARYFRAWALARRGLMPATAAEVRLALTAESKGWRLGLANAHAILAFSLMSMGHLDEARVQFDAAQRHEGETLDVPLPVLPTLRGRFHLETGNPEAALADWTHCSKRLAETQVTNPACGAWRSGMALAQSELGNQEEAERLIEEELRLAKQFGAPGAIGRSLEARGMVREGRERVEALQEALEHMRKSEWLLDRSRVLVELGTALRHENKRAAAREPLREGLELGERCGADALVARARDELLMSGARPRRTTLSGVGSLTHREHQVARLIAEGLSNRAVADTLFVTIKTVEWHLKNVFTKLEIGSRQELAAQLSSGEDTADNA